MLSLEGKHDVDQAWIRDVRRVKEGSSPAIVPRVHFAGWREAEFLSLGVDGRAERLVNVLLLECQCVIQTVIRV